LVVGISLWSAVGLLDDRDVRPKVGLAVKLSLGLFVEIFVGVCVGLVDVGCAVSNIEGTDDVFELGFNDDAKDGFLLGSVFNMILG